MSMPSRAYAPFLLGAGFDNDLDRMGCQCPLGLIPHFYIRGQQKQQVTSGKCQCPHGLIPHFYIKK